MTSHVWATAYYIGSSAEAAKRDFEQIAITKTYTDISGDQKQFNAGDVIEVTITPSVDKTLNPNNMIINDYIPSGMRYIGMGADDDHSDGGWNLQAREGQRVSFVYFNWTYSQLVYDKQGIQSEENRDIVYDKRSEEHTSEL